MPQQHKTALGILLMILIFNLQMFETEVLTWCTFTWVSIGRNDDGMDGSVFHTGDHFIPSVKSFVQLWKPAVNISQHMWQTRRKVLFIHSLVCTFFQSLFSSVWTKRYPSFSSLMMFSSQLLALLSGPVEVALSGFMRAFPIKKKPVASGNYTKQCSDRL